MMVERDDLVAPGRGRMHRDAGNSESSPFTYEARGISESLFTLQTSSGPEVHRQYSLATHFRSPAVK
jgi:hypothetical protein